MVLIQLSHLSLMCSVCTLREASIDFIVTTPYHLATISVILQYVNIESKRG
jgi:hypothetical protein